MRALKIHRLSLPGLSRVLLSGVVATIAHFGGLCGVVGILARLHEAGRFSCGVGHFPTSQGRGHIYRL